MPEKEIKDTKKQKKPAAKKNSSVSRKARHRITSAVLIALVLAGVVILNVIASALTERYSALTADITSAGTYNLTDQTEKILSGLDRDVKIYACGFSRSSKIGASICSFGKQRKWLMSPMPLMYSYGM